MHNIDSAYSINLSPIDPGAGKMVDLRTESGRNNSFISIYNNISFDEGGEENHIIQAVPEEGNIMIKGESLY